MQATLPIAVRVPAGRVAVDPAQSDPALTGPRLTDPNSTSPLPIDLRQIVAATAEAIAPVVQPLAAALVLLPAGVQDRPPANGLAGNGSRVLAEMGLPPAADRSPSFARSLAAAFQSPAPTIVSPEAKAASVVRAGPGRAGPDLVAQDRAAQNPEANDPAKGRDTEVAGRFIAVAENDIGVSPRRTAC